MAPTSVLVVDDAASFRAAAVQVVAAVPGFRVVGVASTGEEALDFVRSTPVDLVLMDVVMPGMDGAAAAGRIHAEQPSTYIVLLSAHASDEFARLPASCPWCTFCPKEDFGPEVLEAWWRAHGS